MPLTAGPMAALLCVAVALAGCAKGGSSDEGAPSAPGPAGSGTASGSPPVAGLGGGEAPDWQVGQWWRWRIDAGAAPQPYEAVTSVLDADASSFDIGTPDAQAAAQVYPFHLVAFGPVPRDTLAWQAHGGPVQFLRFPIVDGDSWTADFWAASGATVTVRNATVAGPGGTEPGYRSEVTYAGGGLFLAASWSTARGQFVEVQSYFGGDQPFATATLIGEGQDGPAAAPFRATDILRLSAKAGDPASMAPVQFQVPADADLLLVACFLGGGPGAFEVAVSYGDPPPPQCNFYTQGTDLLYGAFTRPAAAGNGQLAVVPGGQGGVTVELFGVVTTDAG